MCPPGGGCLSFIYTADLPAAGAAYPPAMDEQPLIAGIFGLATRRMCGLRCRQRSRWSLTPPFHPYPPRERAVIFCHTCPDVAAGFPLGCAVLFVARTFLSILTVEGRMQRQTSILHYKITTFLPFLQFRRWNPPLPPFCLRERSWPCLESRQRIQTHSPLSFPHVLQPAFQPPLRL